jgi:integrase
MPRASLKQRGDGRYAAKYKGRFFMGATQAEAYAKRDAYKRQLEAGLRAEAASVPLPEYAATWLRTFKSGITDNTYNDYARMLDSFVRSVGEKPLKSIVPSDVQQAYNTISGKSRSYVSKYTQLVRGLFRAAVADRLIVSDPCLQAKPPRAASGTHRMLEPWERDLILLSEHRFKPAVMCMLYAGLRRGEALALNVDRDVDFSAMTISVREAVRFEYGHAVLADPKTEAGSRTVPLLDVLADELSGLRGLVAPASSGTLMSKTAFRRAWESYLRHLSALAGKPVHIQAHDLRHTYCTMLYDSGVDIKTAQKWMGHADQTMTMRIYTHLTSEREAEAARALREKVNVRLPGRRNGRQLKSVHS